MTTLKMFRVDQGILFSINYWKVNLLLLPGSPFRVMFLEAFRCLPSKETFQLNFINANANVPVVSNIAQ